jgi:hypothetical protein
MNVPDSRVRIRFELIPAPSKQEFDGAKVFLANVNVLSKLSPDTCKLHVSQKLQSESMHLVKSRKCDLVVYLGEHTNRRHGDVHTYGWLFSQRPQTLPIERQDISLKSR